MALMNMARLIRQFIFLFLLVSWIPSEGQLHPILGKFLATEVDGYVYLSWIINSGSTCNGIQIYRSTDNTNFMEIGRIPGVCGSTSESVPYDFTDNNPEKNKVNYYRLELGSQGYSQILSVEIIDLTSGGYLIRPNPVHSEARIYFGNATRKEFTFTIYNLSGKAVYSSRTKDDFFLFNSSPLPSGTYIFTIGQEKNSPDLKGKVVIAH